MRRSSPWANEEHRSWRWVPRRSLLPRRTFDAGWLWPGQAFWVWECKWGWGFHDLYPYRYRSSYYVVETLNAVSVATEGPEGQPGLDCSIETETMMRELLFIQANAHFPRGEIFSTARRGDKWSKQATPGDVVDLMITESRKHIGRATVVGSRLTTFKDAVDNCAADKNCSLSPGMDDSEASAALKGELEASYKDLTPDEPFTVLSLIAHNPE